MKRYLSADDIAAALRAEGDTAVSGRTVHYYAEQHVLPPPEYDGTRPRYTEVHLVAMRRARELKRQGYTLQAIEQMMDAPVVPASSPRRRTPAAPAPAARAPSSALRTLVVAPGLTLSALGWDDATLDAVVRAIHATLEEQGRADARERDDHDPA